MSSFTGIVKEFRGVSIDRFDGPNLDSNLYLLSHCHADHMRGLDQPAFFERLRNANLKLLCHNVSAAFLKAMDNYKHLSPYVESLDTDVPYSYSVDLENSSYQITVTLLPAGHCPGSVMFVLESDAVCVLYTGDFRLEVTDCPRLKCLFSSQKEPLYLFDNVYVDTTFCSSASEIIPSRKECLDVIFNIASTWICSQKGLDLNIVHVENKTRYGYEFLMKALAKRFKCKVHVNQNQFDLYKFIPDIQDFLTVDASSTKIHFCKPFSAGSENLAIPCLHSLHVMPRVLKVIPTAMFFTIAPVAPSELVRAISGTKIRCCYSTHSSLSEVVDFLSHLKFKNVTPFVKPNSDTSIDAVKCLLLQKLSLRQSVQIASSSKTDNSQKIWSEKLSFKSSVKHLRLHRKSSESDENLVPSRKKSATALETENNFCSVPNSFMSRCLNSEKPDDSVPATEDLLKLLDEI